MKTAIIRSNFECNLKCLFCTAAGDTSERMTTDEIKKKIKAMKKNGIERLILTGGEPTLRSDIVELISYSKSSGIKLIDLQSNSILFSDENFVLKLKKAGLNFVTVGFSSHKKDNYNYLTDSKSYDLAVLGIRNLVKNNITVCVYHVINSRNYKQLINFIDFIQSISEKIEFAFAFLRPNGNTQKNKHIVPRLSEIEFYIRQMFEYLEKKGIDSILEGVPLCYLPGFENKSVETKRLIIKPVPYISEDETKHDSLYDDINRELKRKSAFCSICTLNSLCVGIWKEYAEIYGTKELYPVFMDEKNLEMVYKK